MIRYFEFPYFLASKFVALGNRGGDDLRISSDFENIIYVLDNSTNLLAELKSADKEVVDFLKSECTKLLTNYVLEESIACALPLNSGEDRIKFIVNTLNQIIQI